MTEELILSGADIVKVGIGPGSVQFEFLKIFILFLTELDREETNIHSMYH